MSAPPPAGAGGNRLFVGNLSWDTTDETLYQAFCVEDKTPVEAKVITDRYTGRSRGFGFVTYDNPDLAAMALERMQNKQVDNRQVRVDIANSPQHK